MPANHNTVHIASNTQFGLSALMEFVTICAMLFALSPAIGVTTSILLALMALALATKHGLPVVFLLCAAFTAADVSFQSQDNNTRQPQIMVILLSLLLCAWFRFRHR